MSKKLKVFGGCYDGRNRLIVAAYTKKAAFEAVKATGLLLSYPSWNEYTEDSGNEEENNLAIKEVGVVFSQNLRTGVGFQRIEKVTNP